jgi:hypothetical protein
MLAKLRDMNPRFSSLCKKAEGWVKKSNEFFEMKQTRQEVLEPQKTLQESCISQPVSTPKEPSKTNGNVNTSNIVNPHSWFKSALTVGVVTAVLGVTGYVASKFSPE